MLNKLQKAFLLFCLAGLGLLEAYIAYELGIGKPIQYGGDVIINITYPFRIVSYPLFIGNAILFAAGSIFLFLHRRNPSPL